MGTYYETGHGTSVVFEITLNNYELDDCFKKIKDGGFDNVEDMLELKTSLINQLDHLIDDYILDYCARSEYEGMNDDDVLDYHLGRVTTFIDDNDIIDDED